MLELQITRISLSPDYHIALEEWQAHGLHLYPVFLNVEPERLPRRRPPRRLHVDCRWCLCGRRRLAGSPLVECRWRWRWRQHHDDGCRLFAFGLVRFGALAGLAAFTKDLNLTAVAQWGSWSPWIGRALAA